MSAVYIKKKKKKIPTEGICPRGFPIRTEIWIINFGLKVNISKSENRLVLNKNIP